MLTLQSTPVLAIVLLVTVLSAAASSETSSHPAPHAGEPLHLSLLELRRLNLHCNTALPPSEPASSLFSFSDLDSSSDAALEALHQPLPFKIKRPRAISSDKDTSPVALERVQQNLGKRLAKRGEEESSRPARVPFVSRTATATAGGGSVQGGGGGTARMTQRVTGGAGSARGSVAAAQPVPSTTRTVETGSNVVSTGLLTMGLSSVAAGGGGTVTQVETASSGVVVTSTMGPASSASASEVASAQAAEGTASTSMISGAAAASRSLRKVLLGGVAGAAVLLLLR